MKKNFTLVIIMICLSLFGLMFIQLNWVKTNMEVQRMRYGMEVQNVLSKSREDMRTRLIQIQGRNPATFNIGFDQTREHLLWNTVVRLPQEEIVSIIQKHMDAEKIKFPFAYCITSEQGFVDIMSSSTNFNISMFDVAYPARLTPNGSFKIFLYIEEPQNYISQRSAWMFAGSALFTIIIVTAFALTVRTMINQKKLAEIKSDFINNMTHEFKTPLATISLAVDALKNEKVLQNAEKIDYFRTIIKEENLRMNKQVETILKASQLEKQEVDLALSPLHVHDIIQDVVANFALQLEDKNGKAELNLQATNDLIEADEVHFGNLINNLVDNAVKYSKTNVAIHIKISSQNTGKKLVLRFEDNGIGMSKETVKRVFERFYRAHTGNLHNVKGFGLGLSYVKSMIEAHHGEIKVESTLGKGSIFTIELPLKK